MKNFVTFRKCNVLIEKIIKLGIRYECGRPEPGSVDPDPLSLTNNLSIQIPPYSGEDLTQRVSDRVRWGRELTSS